MTLTDGGHTAGPDSGRLLVRTGRSGLGRRAGHDLTIEVTRWDATADVDTADPARSQVVVSVDADSLEVREGVGGVKPLTDSDRAEIHRNIRDKVLHTDRYPEITFRSTRIDGTPGGFDIEGELTIMGTTRPVRISAAAEGNEVRGTATITQSEWGIKPYSAFLGALRLADEVEITFAVTL